MTAEHKGPLFVAVAGERRCGGPLTECPSCSEVSNEATLTPWDKGGMGNESPLNRQSSGLADDPLSCSASPRALERVGTRTEPPVTACGADPSADRLNCLRGSPGNYQQPPV